MNILSDPVVRPVHVQLVPAILRYVKKSALEIRVVSGKLSVIRFYPAYAKASADWPAEALA